MQYDVASDEYREILKSRIMDQVEKYFMLIVFSMYCKQVYFHHLRIYLSSGGQFCTKFLGKQHHDLHVQVLALSS